MNNNKSVNIAKGIAAGVVIGGAIGATVVASIHPQKRNALKKSAVNMMDTVGSIMQSIAEYAR